jgi:hypothetical protein
MKLSDLYTDEYPGVRELLDELSVTVPLELTLTVININKGRNLDLIAKSEILSGYVEFIDRVTRYRDEGMSRSDAITKAVRECIADDVLKEYLEKHGAEVHNMLIQEWDTQEAKKVWAEEAYEDGQEYGRKEERTKWQSVVAEWQSAVAVKDAVIADKDAEVEALRKQLDEMKSKLAAAGV